MKIRNFYYILLGIFAFSVIACEEANEWEVDPSHDRLFRSTKFEVKETNPTSALLSFRGVTNATKYVFDFSEGDSLLFNNIVFTTELLVDTMNAYNKEASEIKTEYRALFTDLNGTTRYSVRMKAVNGDTGMESGYVQLCFDTTDEQIFTTVTPGTTSVSLNWQAEKTATRIEYGELVKTEIEGEEAKTDTVWATPHELTSTEKQAGELTIDGLKPGTNYITYIFNEKARRGSYKFKTLGSSKGTTISVKASDDINALLAGAPAGDVTLSFTGGQTYEVGEFTIPETVTNLYIAGNVVGGKMPVLNMTKFVFSALMDNFYVQYMDIVSDGKSQFMIELGGSTGFKNVSFEGCNISEIPRSLIRTNSGDLEVEGIVINNCFIKNVGLSGYGLLNIGKLKSLSTISITNTTLLNIGDQIMDLRVQTDKVTFTQSIFCNYDINMPKLLRLDKQPKEITVTGVIFTGDNKGGKMNSGNSDYSKYLSFAGCYLTSDFQENDKKFTDAQILKISSEELFEDPKNGDFHFKPEAKFEGDGKVGDPRWWTK
ncbi:DUF5123 domain-containing protein [Bacteroides cellulosilyticus]|uniref:DUF5123 domain-containing protein n=1 Tax=Bacteroides cellulosilyticus TaxID=246787 RepID=UPI00234C2C9E|nr:DUF5123 domain-containing protein [Bacteroides cellulosilyticus]MDC7178112.1 DUF5123 domain-containing protein [Bacteroides cellulosilyticus]MDC7182568.1 DUF5123 domain-containing protein [Bacteroides cellulosilyticus]